MRFEFELDRNDWLKKCELVNGKTVPYGKWTVWLLLVCSIAQVLILWFIEQSPYWTVVCLAICVWMNVKAFRRLKSLTQFNSYRTELEFHDEYLSEKSHLTEYQKAYSFLHSVESDDDYIIFHHLGNSTFLPKRVMSDEQIDWVLNEVGNRIETSPKTVVPNYKYIEANQENTFKFEWNQEDIEQLATEAFVPFIPDQDLVKQIDNSQGTTISKRGLRLGFLIPAAIFIAIGIWKQSIVMLPIVAFLLMYILFNELAYAQEIRRRKSRTQDVLGMKTEFCVGGDVVWIGIQEAVDRHALENIVQVHCGLNFVALQSRDGLLFVLARRAIGDEKAVSRFLTESTYKLNTAVRQETGNPYQPPAL